MRLQPETLSRALEGRLAQAWLVAGDEPLRVGEAADLIRARARQDGYTGREVWFADRSFDWNELLAGLRAMSLFAERRIVELRLANPKPGVEGSKALIAALEDPAPDVLLLMITDKIEWADRQNAWVKAFETKGCCLDVEQLLAEQLPAWITARMRRVGLEPGPEAAELLAERCEGNLVAAHQEIELLALLHGRGVVTVDTVAAAVANSARYHVFQLGEALLGGDPARAVRILEGLAAEGEEPTLVLWCLSEELRSILQWRPDAGGAKRLFRGGRRRKEQLANAARRVPRSLAQDLLTEAARLDGVIKGPRKDEAWGTLARIATDLCIAVRNRAG